MGSDLPKMYEKVNKRAYNRQKVLAPVEIAELDEHNAIIAITPGHLCDMSQGGFRIITKKLIYDNTRIAVRMRTKTEPAIYGGIVRNVRYDEKLGYSVGCKWLPKKECMPSSQMFDEHLKNFELNIRLA